MAVFSDDFESGTLAAWDSTTGAVSVITDPTGSGHGKVLKCDCSAGDAFLTKNVATLGLTTPWTLSFDVYIPSATASVLASGSGRSALFANLGFDDAVQIDGGPSSWEWDTFDGTTETIVPTFDAWHHVKLVYDGHSVYWTVDGSELNLATQIVDISDLMFGASSAAGVAGEVYYLDNVAVDEGGCIPPTANFTYTLNGTTVTFIDESTGTITGWSWDLGDGNTSTAEAPVHPYASKQCWTVTLTVTGGCGSSTITLTVNTDGYDSLTGGAGGASAAGRSLHFNDPAAGWVAADGSMVTWDGLPVIGWTEQNSTSDGIGGPYVAVWNGTDWGTIMDTVGSTGTYTPGAGTGIRAEPRFATDGTNLYMAYALTTASDKGQIEVYKYDGTSWTRLGNVSAAWIFEVGEVYRPNFDICADAGEPGACYVAVSDSADSGGTTNRVVVAGFGSSSLGEVLIVSAGGPVGVDNTAGDLAVYYITDSSQINVWTPGGTGTIGLDQFHQTNSSHTSVTWTAFSAFDGVKLAGDGTHRWLAISLLDASSNCALAFVAIDPAAPFAVRGIDCNSSQEFEDSTEVIYFSGTPEQLFYAEKILVEDRGFWMLIGHDSGGDVWLAQLDRHCSCMAGQWPTWRDPGQSFGMTAPFTHGGGYNVTADTLVDDGIWAYDNATGVAVAMKHPINRNVFPCPGCRATAPVRIWQRF